MKKRKINPFDELVEKLALEFSKIKDFDLMQESEEGKRAFKFIIESWSQMETFEALFLNYYIPAANKSISDTRNQLLKSKYRGIIGLNKEGLYSNLYETVRLGYVGLFHKYESFLNSVIECANYILQDLNAENNLLPVDEYSRKRFDVNLYKSHHLFPVVSKINYIGNCVKHYDGMPVKSPIHPELRHLSQAKRIEIRPKEFGSDIKRLKSHCRLFLSQVLAMGFKQFFEQDYKVIKPSLKPELQNSPEAEEKITQIVSNLNFVLSDFTQPQN